MSSNVLKEILEWTPVLVKVISLWDSPDDAMDALAEHEQKEREARDKRLGR